MNYRDLFKIVVRIADVHIGRRNISPEEYKYQLKKGVIDKLKKLSFVDMIVICGDTLNEKILLNSEYSNIFFWFISTIVDIAIKKGNEQGKKVVVRILKGTKFHDEEQLENILFYEDYTDLDFKIITKKYEEEVNGCIYGYLPEEYVSNPDEYYKDFFDKPDNYYDMVFGHGLITECKFMHQDSEMHSVKTYVFSTSELMRVCKGPIGFGHIHTRLEIKNKFYYIGSTLRLCHGEEEAKGFDVVTYIKDNGIYRVDHIKNEYVLNFNTLKIDTGYMEHHTVDEIIEYTKEFIKRNKTDKLSIKITCVDYKETVAKIALLKKYFDKDKNIKADFRIMSRTAYDKEVESTKNNEIKPYLQKGLTIVEQIKLWALEKRQTRLEDADIERFLAESKILRKGVELQ